MVCNLIHGKKKFGQILQYLKFPGDNSECCGIEVGGGQDLIELGLFLLQGVSKCPQFLLKKEILEVTLLLHLMDGLHKLPVQVISLILSLFIKLNKFNNIKLSTQFFKFFILWDELTYKYQYLTKFVCVLLKTPVNLPLKIVWCIKFKINQTVVSYLFKPLFQDLMLPLEGPLFLLCYL